MSKEWKHKGLPSYLKGKPAQWDEESKEWIAYDGINDVNIKNLPSTQNVEDVQVKEELQNIKQIQNEIITSLQTTNESLLATNEHLSSVIENGRLQSDTQLIDEEPIPIINQGNSFGMTLLEEGDLIPSGGSKTVSTRGFNLSGVHQMTIYIGADREFRANGYIYDYVTGRLVRDRIDMFEENTRASLSRPVYYEVKAIPVTKMFAVIITNNSEEDMSATINIGANR